MGLLSWEALTRAAYGRLTRLSPDERRSQAEMLNSFQSTGRPRFLIIVLPDEVRS